jgi:hypothetical protein
MLKAVAMSLGKAIIPVRLHASSSSVHEGYLGMDYGRLLRDFLVQYPEGSVLLQNLKQTLLKTPMVWAQVLPK